jgi:hypothetical protein
VSDETPRSSHGLPSDARGTNQPPGWWRSLGREDLPDDNGRTAQERRALGWLKAEDDVPLRELSGIGQELPSRGNVWLMVGVAVLVAALLAVAAALAPRGGIAVVAPVLVAVLVVGLALLVRRRRQR